MGLWVPVMPPGGGRGFFSFDGGFFSISDDFESKEGGDAMNRVCTAAGGCASAGAGGRAGAGG